MLDRDWLDALIEELGKNSDGSYKDGVWFKGARDVRDAILAAQSHLHSWEGPIWCCDVCGPCESEPCGLGNCVAAPPVPLSDPEHVLRVEIGEFTQYHLTCNLDETAKCHQTCQTHPEGGCDDPDNESECITSPYKGGCVVAEWVNDGGIEAVQFEHTLELPVSYYWDGAHDFPILVARAAAPEPPSVPAPEREIDVCTRCGEECKDQDLTGCEGCRLSPSEVRREGE